MRKSQHVSVTSSPPSLASPTSEWLELSGAPSGIPGFAAIGRRHYRSARQPVSAHEHPCLAEISFMARGQQAMQVGRERRMLRRDEVLVIPAGAIHGSAGQPAEHCTLYWLHLDLRERNRFLTARGESARALMQRLRALQGMVLTAPPWLVEAFDLVMELCGRSKRDALEEMRLQHELIRIVLGMIDAQQPASQSATSDAVRITQEHVAAHLGDSLRVDELAEIVGISPTRLIALFRRDTKLTPREYVLRQKVAGSKRMLQDPNQSITQIAHALGFSTSQYYATVFRRFEGISPGDYRRNATDGLNT
jgi:AraC-like DNA-binding protein/quercetin dioxygenase-like cupin family protein